MQPYVMWTIAVLLMMFCFCAGRMSKEDNDKDITGGSIIGIALGVLALLAAHYA